MSLHHWLLLMAALLTAGIVCNAEEIYPALNHDPEGASAGMRPYEMDWAERHDPVHPQLVDFEDLSGWRVRCFDGATATLMRSRQKLLFGNYTGRVEYSGASHASRFIIEPPEPIHIPVDFTAVNLWIHGNTWSFDRNQKNALVGVNALVEDANDRIFSIPLDNNTFNYWFLSHRTCVSPDGSKVMYIALDGRGERIQHPARFTGIEITGVHNEKTETLHFDALQFYEITYPALDFVPAPDTLPWPTTTDTILPSLNHPAIIAINHDEQECHWQVSSDETLDFFYTPRTGRLDDIKVIVGGRTFFPCAKGGIHFELGGKSIRPDNETVTVACTAFEATPGGCRATWELDAYGQTVRYIYELTVKGKSLIVDVFAPGGEATRLDIGGAYGLDNAKTVYFPYLTYGDDWPKTICATGPEGPLFLWAACDYYNSDASELFGPSAVGGPGIIPYTGGALYKPTTAGVRNPMRERIFINVSSDVHETLPNIPNPDSQNAHLAREYLWQNIGQAHQRERLARLKAFGVDNFIACHHEVGWREGGESFTLRDRPADSIGETALAEYGAFVRGLGYYFGTYTNYVDFAPVNANWDENHVVLNSDGTWQRAWPRCYALKPLRAVEFEALYAPRIQARYGANAQYCDVHTAYTPWGRTDYDARTPGAGKFRTQFDAYARLLQNESRVYGGPVFSEGNYHWFYAGIVDGNYATVMPYGEGWKVEPLVDFDLLKMHTKMTDFGMGFGEMFYGYQGDWNARPNRLNPWFERFTASTIAFGHIGFLTYEWGVEATLKGYYQMQALQTRYALIPVEAIRYHDGEALLDTSTAIANDAYKRRHIHVVYENGLRVWVNLSHDLDWPVTLNEKEYLLTPTGFLAYKPDDILTYAASVDGKRHDLVYCTDYLYLDSRNAYVDAGVIAGEACVAVKPDGPGVWWLIPTASSGPVSVGRDWLGVDRHARMYAQAVNEAGEALHEVEIRHGADRITVMPSDHVDAIKYRLQDTGETGSACRLEFDLQTAYPGACFDARLFIEKTATVPDEHLTVEVFGADNIMMTRTLHPWHIEGEHAVAHASLCIPEDTAPRERCWFHFTSPGVGADMWLDAFILPALDIQFSETSTLLARKDKIPIETIAANNMPVAIQTTLALEIADHETIEKQLSLAPGETTRTQWEAALPESLITVPVILRASEPVQQEIQRFLCMEYKEHLVVDLTQLRHTAGQRLRGEPEMPYDHPGTLAVVTSSRDTLDGTSLDGFHMHPPYATRTGYVFAQWDVQLPPEPARFDFALGFRPGSSSQDGCVFEVEVEALGKRTTLFSEQYQRLDAWARRSVDLNDYAGESIRLKLITDAGPDDNTYSDWALWGAPRIVLQEPMREIKLLEAVPHNSYSPPPAPVADLSLAALGAIRAAHISFEGAGVDGGAYEAHVYFNEIRTGALPPSGSDTEWRAFTVLLSEEAQGRIKPFNTLTIRNPNHDYMKLRNACLYFELEDGRTGSSYLAPGPWTSGAGWLHEEGESVPIGHDLGPIRLDIPVLTR